MEHVKILHQHVEVLKAEVDFLKEQIVRHETIMRRIGDQQREERAEIKRLRVRLGMPEVA